MTPTEFRTLDRQEKMMSYRRVAAEYAAACRKTLFFDVQFTDGSTGRIAAENDRDAQNVASRVAKVRKTAVSIIRPCA